MRTAVPAAALRPSPRSARLARRARRPSWLHGIRDPGRPPANDDGARVREIMTAGLVIVTGDTPLADVVALGGGRDPVVVVDAHGQVLGLLGPAATAPSPDATAAAAAWPLPFALSAESTVARAAALMAYEGCAHLVVVDDDGRVVGLISALDVVRHHARAAGYVVGTPRRW